MPDLLFEIWRDPANHSQSMTMVCREGDGLRRRTSPNAKLVHSFMASSDFDAFQKNHDWNGWDVWTPPSDITEHTFTEDEAAAQQLYLQERDAV